MDLNHRPHPCQFIPGAGMLAQAQAVAAVRGWPDEAVDVSAVVSCVVSPAVASLAATI